MKSITTTRKIDAPIETVFKTIADVRNFAKAVPGISNIEFLSDQHYGVGTRFRETRSTNGKESSVELEVTELVENYRIRIVSDEGGTIWDTVFTVRQEGDLVDMTMKMDANSYKLVAKIITPLIFGMVSRIVESDMDAVKCFCEKK